MVALTLSILDQSPIQEGETATEAFQHTIRLAQKAEDRGYHRFWVAEHHDLDHVVGSSPEVLIAHLLAKTERIRIGSGGVMLQHYSPYKVAENFHVLAALAPGRVDLGIGRAPGGLPLSTKALQPHSGTGSPGASLEEKLAELALFLRNELPPTHPLYGLTAVPLPSEPVGIYLLGTSAASAQLAAERGVPYVFALFISQDEAVCREAFDVYRQQFQPGERAKPLPILAVSVIVAQTEEEALQLAAETKIAKIHLQSGKTVTVTSLKKAEEYGRQADESFRIEVKEANVIAGTKESVRERLLELARTYQVGELVIHTPIKHFAKRLLSYELLHEAFAELSVT
ncbi:LLM class flavin-dependent oxidoreductase [Brevibacillus agri]|uniref:LLM class flavin-dependent oxidoreductase n=1 Tax=Brevibacillus agri TaxID=51101 RepID=UPI003D1F4287